MVHKTKPVMFDDDNPEWTEENFARARPANEVLPPEVIAAFGKGKRGRPIGSTNPDKKEPVTIRIDADVLAAFKAGGAGWQTRMNEVLRKALPKSEAAKPAPHSLWAVVVYDGDYSIRPVEPGEAVAADVIAYHPDKHSADLALERVIAMNLGVQDMLREPIARETDLRAKIAAVPGGDKHPDRMAEHLNPSLAHEAHMRNGHLQGVFEIARPRAETQGKA